MSNVVLSSCYVANLLRDGIGVVTVYIAVGRPWSYGKNFFLLFLANLQSILQIEQ
jgi:hypothetical protein